MESHVSDIVLSLSGRDKGQLMVVVREDGDYLWLANGKGRRRKPQNAKSASILRIRARATHGHVSACL